DPNPASSSRPHASEPKQFTSTNVEDDVCRDTVGNELTTAVQLIAFLKKQISESRRPKVHDCPRLDVDFLVADSTFMKVAFGVGFKMLLFNPLAFSKKDLSRNLKLTVSNSSLGEDC
ncbi:hypothetical protein Tco_0027837, partial [Tanacetum coccineum]